MRGPYRADDAAGAAISDEEMVWCRALVSGGEANVAALLVSHAVSTQCVVSNRDGLMVVAGTSSDPMLAAFLARLGATTTVGDMHVAARAQASSAAPALLAKANILPR